MKQFILRILLFSLILLSLLLIGIIMPATPKESRSLLFAKIHKDALFKEAPSPRIIFIGGSNLSFGLNSQMIKDSLHRNPVNTSIHASLGLIYMMDDALKYIRSGDLIVVVPEYPNYYADFAYGGEELLRTIMDLYPLRMMELRSHQWANILKYLPKYCCSKFRPGEYIPRPDNLIYGVNSFNMYGDVFTHWRLKSERFSAVESINGEFNEEIVEEMLEFKKRIEMKGAFLYISFPGFQATSFENCKAKILKSEIVLKKKGFQLLGNPERYKTPDSLMFNGPYHLSKAGVDRRTLLLIEDIKKLGK